MGDLGKMRLTRLGIRLGRAVKERGANAAFEQSAHCRVGMRGGRIVVTPVDQRGDAVIDLVERTDERGRPAWTFPALDAQAGSDPSWSATLEIEISLWMSKRFASRTIRSAISSEVLLPRASWQILDK